MPLWNAQVQEPRYYGFGALAVDQRIYQFLCSATHPSAKGFFWNGVKLVYSADRGRTWRNQNGSTPIVWESYESRSRETLLFFEEPNEAFSLVSVLQMGRNYRENRDGFVYGYGVNGGTDGTMNQLVLLRVPKDRVLSRAAYEFFSATTPHGEAIWSKQIADRAAVYTFPRGWVNLPKHFDQNVVQSWVPSVVYNAPLNVYLMACAGIGCSSDGVWFAKPSYLGFWVASQPWGPWTQIYEAAAWTPGGETAARCYSPQIAPKWIAPDGKSFWLVWSDYQERDTEFDQLWAAMSQKPQEVTAASWVRLAQLQRQSQPYYSFNAQRFDLATA
jgi:hypothetical protein